MQNEKVQEIYTTQVIPFLQYRIGGQLTSMITSEVLAEDLASFNDSRDAFEHLLSRTFEYQIAGNSVIQLVFEKNECDAFFPKFLKTFDQVVAKNDEGDSFDSIFDDLVSDYLQDILGAELVETVKSIFIKAVAAIPDQPVDVRFYIGMQAIYDFIPDVWGEVEFAEKVKALSQLLPGANKSDGATQSQGKADFDELVDKIIVADLAEIMGKGHALQTVMDTAREKIHGIYYDEGEQFSKFVDNILEDNFIVRMFDSYWIEERRKKWLEEVELFSMK